MAIWAFVGASGDSTTTSTSGWRSWTTRSSGAGARASYRSVSASLWGLGRGGAWRSPAWGDGVPTVTILDVVGRERTGAPQSTTGFEAFPWHGFALTVGSERGVVDQPALRRPLLGLPRSLTRAGKVVSARVGTGEEPPRSRSETAKVEAGAGPGTEWTMAATGRRGVAFRRDGSPVMTLAPRLRFRPEPGADARDFTVTVALEATVSAHVFVL